MKDYKSANSKWKFGRIINKDGSLHYTINLQGAIIRCYVNKIRPVGEREQQNNWMGIEDSHQ